MTITLTAADAKDQNVTVKGEDIPPALQALFKPYGDGKRVLGVVQLADGLHVRYYGGKRLVFQPVPYSGRVTDGETPGTFVAQLDTPQGSQPA